MAEGARLESVYTFTGIGGSNPSLSAIYLVSAKKLLLTEPANSRVWVSSISTDSFGGTHEIVKGWTQNDTFC